MMRSPWFRAAVAMLLTGFLGSGLLTGVRGALAVGGNYGPYPWTDGPPADDWLDFAAGQGSLRLTAAAGSTIKITLTWTDPAAPANSDYDLYLCTTDLCDQPGDSVGGFQGIDTQGDLGVGLIETITYLVPSNKAGQFFVKVQRTLNTANTAVFTVNSENHDLSLAIAPATPTPGSDTPTPAATATAPGSTPTPTAMATTPAATATPTRTPTAPSSGGGGGGGGPTPTATAIPQGPVTVTIDGAAGGAITSPDGRVRVSFPAGAFGGSGRVTLEPVKLTTVQGGTPALLAGEERRLLADLPRAPEGTANGSIAFTLSVAGADGAPVAAFSPSAEAAVRFTAADLSAAGGSTANLKLYRLNAAGSGWTEAPVVVDSIQSQLRVSLSAPGTLGLFIAVPGPTLAGPADNFLSNDLAPLLTWTNPAGTTQYQIQIIPANNEAPASI
jgi:hypothetical protein